MLAGCFILTYLTNDRSSIIESLESFSSEGAIEDCHRNTIVQLNVGGELVSTYLGTLIEMEGTYFSNCLSGRFRIDHDRPLFIDRDPICEFRPRDLTDIILLLSFSSEMLYVKITVNRDGSRFTIMNE